MSVGRALLFSSTLVVWAVIVHSLVGGYQLSWFSGGLLLSAYLGVFLLGAVFPSLEMYGEVLSRIPEMESRAFALTFDDGPDDRSTPDVLRLLAKYHYRATFFCIGEKARSQPEVLRQIVAEGHELALHSMKHSYFYSFFSAANVQQDIDETQLIFERVAGRRARFFRPPVLVASPRTFEGARRAGVTIVGASVRAFDGTARANPAKVRSRLLRVRAGDVVLVHDASEKEGGPLPVSLQFLEEFLEAWSKRGLVSVTLSELIQAA